MLFEYDKMTSTEKVRRMVYITCVRGNNPNYSPNRTGYIHIPCIAGSASGARFVGRLLDIVDNLMVVYQKNQDDMPTHHRHVHNNHIHRKMSNCFQFASHRLFSLLLLIFEREPPNGLRYLRVAQVTVQL